eukprot:8264679-Pyramimonas_sp.AAC.2
MLWVQAEAFSCAHAPCAPSPLRSLCLADGADFQGVHASGRVVLFLLHQTRVHYVNNAGHCQRGLCDVGGNHYAAAPLGGGSEHPSLHKGGLAISTPAIEPLHQ